MCCHFTCSINTSWFVGRFKSLHEFQNKTQTKRTKVKRTFCFQGMASTLSLLDEKHFLCSLCKDIFTNPATIPCGHSYCLSCLCRYWTRHQSKYCPNCKRVFTDKPDLCVNHILADVSNKYRNTRPQKPPDDETVRPSICLSAWWPHHLKINYIVYFMLSQIIDIEQMIQERLQKIERLKHSLELQKVR